MNPEEFERLRLAFFAAHGFEGESRWLTDREGQRSYAVTRGDGSCPVVLVHGGLSEASEWFPLARHIPGAVVLADRPGCGLSYRIDYLAHDGAAYLRAAEHWLADLVDALGAERIDIVANSMGGYFAMAYVTAHPGRVRRLVFVGAPAGLDRPIPLFLRLWGNPIVGRAVGRMVVAMRAPEAVRKRVMPMLAAHPERLPTGFLTLALAAQKLPGAEVAARTMLRTVLDRRGWRPAMMMRDALAAVAVPTTFVWGDRDVFAPPSSGGNMAGRMPDARITKIPDAGHLPQFDQPAAVARAVVAALADG